ncbi:N-acetylglucosaminyl deacetylase, LmbE family [Geodermatophilus pulveris]|uniref:N-acetylglucosaminyl deacetylase, LmbE family n=1 Tax=Geodermatophilus pulveris TaxID=1564159 RepID=A0A239CR13_9ACTN|nr:PIG-L deacetylase family protein [Geodermatophilus pulveris]SNS22359.1 N-acetylglucosaminyl deacetylase, LmbE family [Geodermatophilus pulveris]
MTDRDALHTVHPGDRWLVVVAHPDDEAFGCGSVIARAAVLGAEVTVACATRGEAGEVQAGAVGGTGPDGGDLGALREAELRRSAARLGVARVELLGWRDSGFDGPAAPGTLAAAPLTEVARVVRRRAAALGPEVVVVLDGCDGHRDHRHVRQATRAALAGLPGPRPALWEHTLPNSLMRRWLAETSSGRGDDAYHALDPDSFGRPDREVTAVLDVRSVLDRREAAMAEHRSQRSPFAGLSPELRLAFLGTDHLVRVPLPPGPWPEPWRPAAGARPATHHWDCTTAGWRTGPSREAAAR